jgi:hypothetical protein
MFQFRFLSITSLLLGFVLFGNAQNVQDTSAKEAAYTKALQKELIRLYRSLK